jgi:hypothetical protein
VHVLLSPRLAQIACLCGPTTMGTPDLSSLVRPNTCIDETRANIVDTAACVRSAPRVVVNLPRIRTPETPRTIDLNEGHSKQIIHDPYGGFSLPEVHESDQSDHT